MATGVSINQQLPYGNSYDNSALLFSGANRQFFGGHNQILSELTKGLDVIPFDDRSVNPLKPQPMQTPTLGNLLEGKPELLPMQMASLAYFSEYYMADVFPPRFTDKINISWDKIEFDRGMAGQVPERGVPRMHGYTATQHSDTLTRYGDAFMIVRESLDTEEGQRLFVQYMQMMGMHMGDAMETAAYIRMFEAANIINRYKDARGVIHNNDTIRAAKQEADLFCICNKNPNGLQKLGDHFDRISMATRGVLSNLLITPSTVVSQQSTGTVNVEYNTGGPDGVRRINLGTAAIRTVSSGANTKRVLTPQTKNSDANNLDDVEVLLRSQAQVGTIHTGLSDFDHTYRSTDSSIGVYDSESDMVQTITFHEMIKHCWAFTRRGHVRKLYDPKDELFRPDIVGTQPFETYPLYFRLSDETGLAGPHWNLDFDNVDRGDDEEDDENRMDPNSRLDASINPFSGQKLNRREFPGRFNADERAVWKKKYEDEYKAKSTQYAPITLIGQMGMKHLTLKYLNTVVDVIQKRSADRALSSGMIVLENLVGRIRSTPYDEKANELNFVHSWTGETEPIKYDPDTLPVMYGEQQMKPNQYGTLDAPIPFTSFPVTPEDLEDTALATDVGRLNAWYRNAQSAFKPDSTVTEAQKADRWTVEASKIGRLLGNDALTSMHAVGQVDEAARKAQFDAYHAALLRALASGINPGGLTPVNVRLVVAAAAAVAGIDAAQSNTLLEVLDKIYLFGVETLAFKHQRRGVLKASQFPAHPVGYATPDGITYLATLSPKLYSMWQQDIMDARAVVQAAKNAFSHIHYHLPDSLASSKKMAALNTHHASEIHTLWQHTFNSYDVPLFINRTDEFNSFNTGRSTQGANVADLFVDVTRRAFTSGLLKGNNTVPNDRSIAQVAAEFSTAVGHAPTFTAVYADDADTNINYLKALVILILRKLLLTYRAESDVDLVAGVVVNGFDPAAAAGTDGERLGLLIASLGQDDDLNSDKANEVIKQLYETSLAVFQGADKLTEAQIKTIFREVRKTLLAHQNYNKLLVKFMPLNKSTITINANFGNTSKAVPVISPLMLSPMQVASWQEFVNKIFVEQVHNGARAPAVAAGYGAGRVRSGITTQQISRMSEALNDAGDNIKVIGDIAEQLRAMAERIENLAELSEEDVQAVEAMKPIIAALGDRAERITQSAFPEAFEGPRAHFGAPPVGHGVANAVYAPLLGANRVNRVMWAFPGHPLSNQIPLLDGKVSVPAVRPTASGGDYVLFSQVDRTTAATASRVPFAVFQHRGFIAGNPTVFNEPAGTAAPRRTARATDGSLDIFKAQIGADEVFPMSLNGYYHNPENQSIQVMDACWQMIRSPAFQSNYTFVCDHFRDPFARAIAISVLMTPFNANTLRAMVANNIPPPISFAVVRPVITAHTDGVLATVTGGAAGVTWMRRGEYSQTSALTREVTFIFTQWFKTVVTNPENIQHYTAAHLREFIGGCNSLPLTPAEFVDACKGNFDEVQGSCIFVPVTLDTPELVTPAFIGVSDPKAVGRHDILNKLPCWIAIERAYKVSNHIFSQRAINEIAPAFTLNTVLWTGNTWLPDEQGRCTRFNRGNGHLSHFVVPGWKSKLVAYDK